MRLLAVLALGLAAPALGQASDDPRVRLLTYEPGRIYHIPASPLIAQTVLFALGEQIRSVIISDPSAYQVDVGPSGDSLTLRATGSVSLALVAVKTDAREYRLELAPAVGDPARVPQVVRFAQANTSVPLPALPAAPPALLPNISYRFKGSAALRPEKIGDDGAKTYIEWRPDQPIPAVFAVSPSGNEEMVDGYMRLGRFTIDRVYSRLVFKLDREVTRAERSVTGVRR